MSQVSGRQWQRQTDGTLFVDGPVIHIAFSHYHAPSERRDEQLSIYALSFEPGDLQVSSATPQTWMEIGANQLRMAVAYEPPAKLPAMLPLAPAPPEATSTTAPAAGPTPQSVETALEIKAVVDKQAQELEALRAEWETLKKQLAEQDPKAKFKAKPKPAP